MSFPRYENYKDSGIEWLGEVPEGWEVKPFYNVASERDESNQGMVEDNLLSLSYGRIVSKDITTNDGLLPESFETYQIVRPGDIVFRLTDLQNDKRSLRTAIVCETGIITSAYVATKPTSILPSYLNYLLRAYDETKVFYSMGGGLRQSMKFSDLKRLSTVVPPLPEQQTIAAFLDRETGKIDALVAEQERLIELLKEKRQAVISHAVTKGLEPDVPMKDSGIEWLGEVPEGWEVVKIGKIAELQGGYAFSADTFGIEGVPVVRMNNLKRGVLDLDGVACIPHEAIVQKALLLSGDLLWGMSGSIGETGSLGNFARVGKQDVPCLLNQRVGRFVVKPDLLLTDFLEYIIQSSAFCEQIMLLVTGTAQFNVSSEQVHSCKSTIPLHPEQQAIVAFLDSETAKIDTLITEAQQAIGLLKERRSALISAAVTGKIDVRNYAKEVL